MQTTVSLSSASPGALGSLADTGAPGNIHQKT